MDGFCTSAHRDHLLYIDLPMLFFLSSRPKTASEQRGYSAPVSTKSHTKILNRVSFVVCSAILSVLAATSTDSCVILFFLL